VTAGVGTPGAVPSLDRLGARRPRTGASVRVLARAGVDLLRELLATLVAGLDGLVIGLTVAAIVSTFASGVEKHLGLPWPVESIVAGGGLLVMAAAGAGAARLLRGAVVRGLAAIERRLAGSGGRAHRVLHALAERPRRLLAGLPAGWLGAFAVLLWLSLGGYATGPFGLFAPSGALSPYILLIGIGAGLLAAALHLVREWWRPLGRVRMTAGAVLAAAALVVSGGSGLVLVLPGSSASLVAATAALDGSPPPASVPLGDPGLPGPYAVRTMTYGSGTDQRRPEFGAAVDVTTPTVDASKVLDRLGNGADEARAWFWGFGVDALPLNGRAWLPVGAGPFPLVLMVHGNHAMGDFSDPGYAYLGEHLASRGFIAVSVDENFLNGSWAGDWNGTEQFARAWLLLLHVNQWRSWNAQGDSPFHGLVDMGRIALIGHSRGGEAASVAASIADASAAPRTGAVPWPTGIRIRAVVSIAPSDGQYGSSIYLNGTDLLELAGGYDSDARGWMGLRQYARAAVDDGGFKAAFWSYRSNHGQFNTVWGRSDHGNLGGATLNLEPILDPAEQEDIGRTVIGAFLEASLHGSDGYRDLFRRPMVGRAWLPADDIFLVRSSSGSFAPLTTGNPSQPLDGVTISSTGFDSVRSVNPPLRALSGNQGIQALELRWSASAGTAAWRLDGIAAAARGAGASAVRIALANGTQPGNGGDGEPVALDPRIELGTSDGVTVSLPLSRWGALPPPLVVALAKSDMLTSLGGLDVRLDHPTELVLQTYEIPLADFAVADPAFVPAHVTSLRIVVDRAGAGALWLTEVGLERD
jgi:dienelactone hydrolase